MAGDEIRRDQRCHAGKLADNPRARRRASRCGLSGRRRSFSAGRHFERAGIVPAGSGIRGPRNRSGRCDPASLRLGRVAWHRRRGPIGGRHRRAQPAAGRRAPRAGGQSSGAGQSDGARRTHGHAAGSRFPGGSAVAGSLDRRAEDFA